MYFMYIKREKVRILYQLKVIAIVFSGGKKKKSPDKFKH